MAKRKGRAKLQTARTRRALSIMDKPIEERRKVHGQNGNNMNDSRLGTVFGPESEMWSWHTHSSPDEILSSDCGN